MSGSLFALLATMEMGGMGGMGIFSKRGGKKEGPKGLEAATLL